MMAAVTETTTPDVVETPSKSADKADDVAMIPLFREKTDVNRPIQLIPKEQLDAEFKKTQEDFEVYLKEYEYPAEITKSGKKKLIKKLKMEFFKKMWRKIEREKYKRKRAANPAPAPKRRKVAKLCDSTNKLRVAIDCSFDDLMVDKDIVKLTKQIQRCYSINRGMDNPMQFHLTNIQDKTLARMDGCIDGYKNWDCHTKNESLSDLFKPSDIVYLCAESDNELKEFDDTKVYAIGGFVDHNAHKGVAYERAVKAGFQHARLPIDSFFTISTRKVLTVCHVFEIISNFVVTNDWEKAISKTVPARKGLESKMDADDGDKSSGEIENVSSQQSEPSKMDHDL